ncbi:MAG: PAS domain S-box protein [bacterium]
MKEETKSPEPADSPLAAKERIVREIVELTQKLAELPSSPSLPDESPENISQSLYRTIFDNVTEAFVLFGADGKITHWNKMAEKIFGYSAGEAKGNSLAELIIPESYRNKFEKNILEVAKTGQEDFPDTRHKITAVKKNGSIFPVNLHVQEINQNGRKNMLGTVRDNTENKMLDDQLRILFRALDQSPVSIIITDVNGKIGYVNPMFTEITGYSLEESVGQNTRILRSGHQSPEFYQHLWDTVTSGKEWSGEFQTRKKNGDIYWEYAFISPVTDSEGVVTHFVAIKEDISKRKETEEALKIAKEEAERANKAKSKFLSHMSHELRTPLNAILGFAQILELDTTDPLSPNQKESVTQILKSGRYLLDLINEVLDLSRIESGNLSISVKSINVCEIVSEAISLVEPMAEEFNIGLVDERDSGKFGDYFVMADSTRLKQALFNLLTNAIKYNDEGGKVIISYETSDQFLRIKVEDTGLGIPHEKLSEIFEPFNRLGAENSEVEGTGIGLIITKRLMELMGGTIGIESQPGQGSCFYLDLLTAKSPEPKEGNSFADKVEQVFEKNKPKVLFVDDEPVNLQLFKSIFKQRPDLELLYAHQARLGIEIAREQHPDLILLDINLPDMDGFEVLEVIKADEETKNIPMIAVSGNAMSSDVEKGLSAGFLYYITKPIDVVNFLKIISLVLK